MEFGFGASVLANMNLVGIICFALSCPIWGMMVDRYPRKPVLMTGYWGWIVCLFTMSWLTEAWQFYIVRGINGILLAQMVPVSQSVVTEVVHSSKYGTIFGTIGFFHAIGAIIAGYCGTILSQQTVFGMAGWRFGYITLSCFGLAFGLAFSSFFLEPTTRRELRGPITWANEAKNLKKYITIPSFCFLATQGVFGCMPWHAMHYLTLYFQYNGLSDSQVGWLFGVRTALGSLGAIIGGVLGDAWNRRWKYHGRIMVAVISVVGGIPLMLWCLYLPNNDAYFFMATLTLALFQMTATWTCNAVNRPVSAMIVNESDRGTIFALQNATESLLSAVIAYPILAYLASQSNYQGARTTIANMPEEQRLENAASLRSTMLPLIVVPWLICASFYAALNYTLPRDMEKKEREDVEKRQLDMKYDRELGLAVDIGKDYARHRSPVPLTHSGEC
jgi:MFS family permease